MKKGNKIWVSVPVIVLSFIAQASASDLSKENTITINESTKEQITIFSNGSGEIVISNTEGVKMSLSRAQVDVIKKINFEELPLYNDGQVCARLSD